MKRDHEFLGEEYSVNLIKNTHFSDKHIDTIKKALVDNEYTNITLNSDHSRISGKKKLGDGNCSLYAYFYKNKNEYDYNDKDPNRKPTKSGPCLYMFISGRGLRASFVENIELNHIFNPTEEDLIKMEDMANSLLIMLSQ